MAKKPAKPIEVACPCCHAKLTVDPDLAVVLSHVAPPRKTADVDISDADRLLREEAERREAKFRDSWESEKKKDDVLTRKFEEALKKAKDQPAEKTIRDIDLD
jgi:Zn-finger nucleic acid-binding protein